MRLVEAAPAGPGFPRADDSPPGRFDPVIEDAIKAGQVVGSMQDLRKKFPKMENHLHLKITKDGKAIDPSPWLKRWGVIE